MTLPDVHLADEAVAAFVDDGLSPAARARARRHLRACSECRAVVEAQREAKVLLAACPDPCLPAGLLARLRDIPMTTDLGVDDIVLAVDGDELAWAPAARSGSRPAVKGRPGPPGPPGSPGSPGSSGAVRGGGRASPGGATPAASGRRPSRARQDGRPGSYSSSLPSRRLQRGRRTLAGALAGIALGVIASAASSPPVGTALPGDAGAGGLGSTPTVQPASLNDQLDVTTLRITSRDASRAAAFTVSRPNRGR